MSSFGDILGASVPPLVFTVPPASPALGALWLDTVSGGLYVWNGSAWQASAGASGLPIATGTGQTLVSTGPGTTFVAKDTSILSFYRIVADQAARLAIPLADLKQGLLIYETTTGRLWGYTRATPTSNTIADWTLYTFVPAATNAGQVLVSAGAGTAYTPTDTADVAATVATADAGKLPRLGADGKLATGFLHTIVVSTGAASAGLVPVLDAAGKLDASVINVDHFAYRGNVDLTIPYVAPVPAEAAGNYFTVAKAGALDASWVAKFTTGQAPTAVAVGDSLFHDGTNYHHLANTVNTSDKVGRAGPNAITAGMTMTWAVPTAAGVATIIDGGDPAKAQLDRITVDAGQF